MLVVVNKADRPNDYARHRRVPRARARRAARASPPPTGSAPATCSTRSSTALGDRPGSDEDDDAVRVAVIGRPNVGKSSMVNAFLGSDRVIVSDMAGTTRDAIDTELEVEGRRVILVDTAGLRRRAKVAGTVDYYAQLRSERAVERADVAIVVCDAAEGVTSEDLRVAEMAMHAGCATLFVLNKWDLSETDIDDARIRVARKSRLRPAVITASATRGRNVGSLLPKALRARRPRRLADPDPGAEQVRRRSRRQNAAARQTRPPPAALLLGAGGGEPAAGRDPGQRPQADQPRLGLPPGEPDARGLRARGRAADHRLRPALGRSRAPAVVDARAFLYASPMPTSKPLAEGEHLFTSESVTEGHPDKVADQISDGVLDAILAEDPGGRVACETLVNTGMAVVSGEITTDTYIDIPEIVRETVREIGYDANYGYDCDAHLGPGLDRQAEPRHRPGRRQGLRDAHRPERRRRARHRRRRRPGHDVRLRLERDRGADADADPPRPSLRRTAGGGPQGRDASLPRPRRQDPGHGALRRRPPGRGRKTSDLHPARRGRRLAGRRSAPTSGST